MSSATSQIGSIDLKSRSDLEAWGRRMMPWLVTLLAFVARIYRVDANGLRTDEMYSIWMASRTIPDLLRTMIVEGHGATPPTFNLALHFIWSVSQELWAVRLLSILAGAALVWTSFHLARTLFDFEVAALTALLVALSPFLIEYSQVARAYSLSSLLALLSLTSFALVLISPERRSYRWLYMISTLGAISTHYLTFLVVVFEALVVALLAVTRQITRRELIVWIRLQALIAIGSLPFVWMALGEVPMQIDGSGQTWLVGPSIQGMARTIILWGTGDPSYGAAEITPARVLSLVLLASILAIGAVTARNRWKARSEGRREIWRLVFVGFAFLTPWFLALGISSYRRIFNEKYFLFLIPLMLMVLAWSVLRARPTIIGRTLLILLLGMTFLSLKVFYTSPAGEQWREAVAYLKQEQQTGDYFAVVPGFYMQPVSYYLHNSMPPYDYELQYAPVAISGPMGIVPAELLNMDDHRPQVYEVVDQANVLWLITGYAEVDAAELTWFDQNYTVIDEREFLGVRVIQGQQK